VRGIVSATQGEDICMEALQYRVSICAVAEMARPQVAASTHAGVTGEQAHDV